MTDLVWLAFLAGLSGPLRELVDTRLVRGPGSSAHVVGGQEDRVLLSSARGSRRLRPLDAQAGVVFATKRLSGPAPQVETGWRSRPRMPPPGTGQCRRPSHDPKRNRGFVKATECSEEDRMNSEYEGDSLDGGSSA